MTINEASEQYNIPISILREYESWGLCDTVKTVMGVWQYDDEDIERLSMIMTLTILALNMMRSHTICAFCSREIPPKRSGCGF